MTEKTYPCSLTVPCNETQVSDLDCVTKNWYLAKKPRKVFSATIMTVSGKCNKCGKTKTLDKNVTPIPSEDREETKQQMYKEFSIIKCQKQEPCKGVVSKTKTYREIAPAVYFPNRSVVSENEIGKCDKCNRDCTVKSTQIDWLEHDTC